MKTDCINYGDCRRPVQLCNSKCDWLNKTCWNCANRIGEECEVDGHEVYPDSIPCDEFADAQENYYHSKDWKDQMIQDQGLDDEKI